MNYVPDSVLLLVACMVGLLVLVVDLAFGPLAAVLAGAVAIVAIFKVERGEPEDAAGDDETA